MLYVAKIQLRSSPAKRWNCSFSFPSSHYAFKKVLLVHFIANYIRKCPFLVYLSEKSVEHTIPKFTFLSKKYILWVPTSLCKKFKKSEKTKKFVKLKRANIPSIWRVFLMDFKRFDIFIESFPYKTFWITLIFECGRKNWILDQCVSLE